MALNRMTSIAYETIRTAHIKAKFVKKKQDLLWNCNYVRIHAPFASYNTEDSESCILSSKEYWHAFFCTIDKIASEVHNAITSEVLPYCASIRSCMFHHKSAEEILAYFPITSLHFAVDFRNFSTCSCSGALFFHWH